MKVNNQAIEELCYILFGLKIDYEVISKILINLYNLHIMKLDLVKVLLEKNQEIFKNQLIYQIEEEKKS